MHARFRLTFVVLLIAWFGSFAIAEVGDPTIRTNHPQYAGEGAFQEIEDCVKFATAGKESTQQQAIAMYKWLLTHQWHLASPQEWCVPGRVPDTAATRDYESVVYDANRARFSYGYGLCGTVHSWNEPYWKVLGMNARRRAFPGHTNSEIQYGGSWHAYDTDMAGLLFRKDGVVAGYEDIIRDPTLVDSVKSPLPHYPFAWPSDFNGMKKGWQTVAKGGKWYALYNGGYAAHPGIVHLRAGETFTRWYDRDHYGKTHRRFWHNMPGGPQRDWTFFNNGEPTHDGAKSNARGNATYCNGEFIYEPDLAGGKFQQGVIERTKNLHSRSDSPQLYSSDGSKCSITFRHFSPYVICGDPVDDANPMSAKATDGVVLEAKLKGKVELEVSTDEGQTWTAIKTNGRNRFDLTEQCKGRYGWRIRFNFGEDAGIDALRFTTITQVCQAIYPRLKPNRTTITYNAANRGVVASLPDFSLPESKVAAFEEISLRSTNLAYTGRSEKSRRAYETTNNKPAWVVFKVKAPTRLTEVRAAMRYQLRVPPPEEYDYRLEISTDMGKSWQTFARADIPADNEFSSGWLAGRVDVSAETNTALVRFHMHAGGYKTGLIEAQLYGLHEVEDPQAIDIEYGWSEGGVSKTSKVSLPAGTRRRTFNVETGAKIQDEFVRLIAH